MTRQDVIDELLERGYNVEPAEDTKNGVHVTGVRFLRDGSCAAPCMWTDRMISEAENDGITCQELVDRIVESYKNTELEDFNIDSIASREFILQHITTALQKAGDEKVIKRPCELEGIDEYLIVAFENSKRDGSCSMKVSLPILDRAGIRLEEAWEAADKNVGETSCVESMAAVMARMMDCDEEEVPIDDMPGFLVVSNARMFKGASAILNKSIKSKLKDRFNATKILMIPSSIHECLVLPYDEDMNLDDFKQMIVEVNQTQVDPTEQLADIPYVVNL